MFSFIDFSLNIGVMIQKQIQSIILLIGLLGIFGCTLPPGDGEKSVAVKNTMLITVRSNIEMVDTSGVNATEVARRLIKVFKQAEIPVPGDIEQPHPRFIAIPYVIGKPTGPWQISLEPDNETGVIKIKGWGKDLSNPMDEVEARLWMNEVVLKEVRPDL